MTKNTKTPASGEIVFVPLNRLKKSPKNVRKAPHAKVEIEGEDYTCYYWQTFNLGSPKQRLQKLLKGHAGVLYAEHVQAKGKAFLVR